MLVLSRKVNEKIIIDGYIVLTVVRIRGGIVRIGVDAPVDVTVHRQEVADEIARGITREGRGG
jgi:carbon storage regulator